MNSSRLPNKPLVDFEGQPMIKVVVKRLLSFGLFDHVYVVTDSNEIAQVVSDCNCNVLLSEGHFNSGTQRIASVLKDMEGDIVINIQCDEPIIPKSYVSGLCKLMIRNEVEVGTICHRVTDAKDLFDFNKVKVVFDKQKKAIYFSRHAIPAQREARYDKWLSLSPYYQHVGIYGFKRNMLSSIAGYESLYLEKAEVLEQLNWMQHGIEIYLDVVDNLESTSVDTKEDLERAKQIFRRHRDFNR